ncbi:diguanylate cyclase (GGDEF)-like protein [Inhella inkyongensis]|uniref:Diguanylate cyclase (GGDEF)-like protein n=1 Tax=Inhella inkyongensis TaxID=392593 RepID=A0A840RZT8_9BURK|nr:diguanylate cyclase [Inhella inkyongensis]MBB5202752.1 diguanylate cyclase (GGDEF)-like protein [Inhella inkyongensis]
MTPRRPGSLGLGARLALAMALLGLLAAGLTGYSSYRTSSAMLVGAAEQRLLTATRVLGRQLSVELVDVSRDLLMLAEHPAVANLLMRSDPSIQQRLEDNVALLLQRLVETHPEYFQMRLIDAEAHGLERLRVDRHPQGVLRVVGDELQEKGHLPYVLETLGLVRGSIYMSPARINHETGSHAGVERPTLQMATPVFDAQQKVRGVVVINLDLEGLFRQLAADLPPDLRLFLINTEGDYLIHPEPRQAFAFDRGQRARVQDEFGDSAALFEGSSPAQDVLARSAPGSTPGLLAAFVRQPDTGLRLQHSFILGLAQSMDAIEHEARQLALSTLRLVAVFGALAMLAAVLLARALVQPLNRIVQALADFAEGRGGGELPVKRHDEVGALARGVQAMQQQVMNRFGQLEAQQREMGHLASHDSLTGLLNRRVFLDRLDHALAHAKRSQGELALLFIDLDHFKQINDQYGHAAGDQVLLTVAQRLHGMVREADTVARIGGDEFIVLLDGGHDDAAIQRVADKLLAALAEPIAYAQQALQCGGSIGISRYPHDGQTAADLIAAADRGMYRAKTGGRQRAEFSA